MKESFRQCMAWLHTWTGLVVGWVLFFVFVTGTAGYFSDEISRWMRPELPLPTTLADVDRGAAIDLAASRLSTNGPPAKSWTITLPHESQAPRGTRGLSVNWEAMPETGSNFGRNTRDNLDHRTGAVEPTVEPRATRGGTGLYRMHYELHYMPYATAIRLVGICTMLMLLAVITGVITHKKIFTDFFTFRPGKGQRSWLDAHNVVSVMCLPFFLMITYTGLVFFISDYMPAPRVAVYGEGEVARDQYFQEMYDRAPRKYEPVTLPPQPMSQLLARAEAELGEGKVASVRLEHRSGEAPYVEFRRLPEGKLDAYDPAAVRFHAGDGSPLPPGDTDSATLQTQTMLLNLHEGLFADWWLRWLYFLSGLMGCAVIATGLVLWTVKRRTQHARQRDSSRFDLHGLRLVEVLNAGTIAGLPLAVAAFFLANRLMPVQMADRAQWEFNVLFVVWGCTFLYASLRPLTRAWQELLWLAAAAYVAVPLVNALTTDRHLGVTLAHGDWTLAGFDLTMLALGAGFAVMALKLRRKWEAQPAAKPAASAITPAKPVRAPAEGATAP